MHKTYLNKIELQLIKGADIIVDKIGGFPSMENGRLSSFSVTNLEKSDTDVELVFDLRGWVNVLDFHYTYDYKDDKNYFHKDFSERHIRMLFQKCRSFETERLDFYGGEIKFGGKEQLKEENRRQDLLPGIDRIIERPYCCFYTGHREFLICFDESKCEISAELFE